MGDSEYIIDTAVSFGDGFLVMNWTIIAELVRVCVRWEAIKTVQREKVGLHRHVPMSSPFLSNLWIFPGFSPKVHPVYRKVDIDSNVLHEEVHPLPLYSVLCRRRLDTIKLAHTTHLWPAEINSQRPEPQS